MVIGLNSTWRIAVQQSDMYKLFCVETRKPGFATVWIINLSIFQQRWHYGYKLLIIWNDRRSFSVSELLHMHCVLPDCRVFVYKNGCRFSKFL